MTLTAKNETFLKGWQAVLFADGLFLIMILTGGGMISTLANVDRIYHTHHFCRRTLRYIGTGQWLLHFYKCLEAVIIVDYNDSKLHPPT